MVVFFGLREGSLALLGGYSFGGGFYIMRGCLPRLAGEDARAPFRGYSVGGGFCSMRGCLHWLAGWSLALLGGYSFGG